MNVANNFTLRMRKLFLLVAAAGLTAGVQAAALDLSECSILSGKKSATAYKKWVDANQRRADAGDQDAIRERAGVANNRLACLEEELTGDAGYSVTFSQGEGSTTETTGPAGIAQIEKNATAFKALKEAVKYTHEAGRFDPGYKSMSAQTVARYANVLPEHLEVAYADAAGAYAFDCVLKRSVGHRQAEDACPMIRPARAQLMRKVAPARRAALDAEGQAWAKGLK
jgi:hypothetical protein